MAFVPRTFEEIRDDMIAYMRLHTSLTDFEKGSVIRTILEAAALEDDEQYFQMVQLLDAFRLSTASGQDLDDRVAEFGLLRLQPDVASGQLTILDGKLVTDFMALDSNAGATLLILEDTGDFPTTGYPYNIRIGEGTTSVEDKAVTSNNINTNTLTLSSGTTYAHASGERVSRVTGASDRALSTGIRAQIPAVGTNNAIVYVTAETGTLVNGNYYSTSIQSRAELPGTGGNVGTNRVVEFASSPPFDGAEVTNLSNFGGGRDKETDAELRDRARALIQSLSRGTVLALKEGVVGVEDSVTGQRVVTSSVLENFSNDEVILYIDDGTGFSPDSVDLAVSELLTSLIVGSATITIVDSSDWPAEGYLLLSPENSSQIEVCEYTAINYATHTITLAAPTANAHDAGDQAVLVDLITDAAESGQNFFHTATYPIVRNSVRVWLRSGSSGAFTLLSENTDYVLNRATGILEILGAGVAVGSGIVLNYTYYSGLVAVVQKVVDGDPDDAVAYPGIRAAGVKVFVETPIIRRIGVQISVTAAPGFEETELYPPVQQAIEAYINSLGIGEDVIRSEIIARAMDVDGIYNAVLNVPASDTVVLENELPVPYNDSGETLVAVS